jgi:superfamily II DNA/RNA helicase
MGNWKKISSSNIKNASDCMFLSLEEIDEKDLFASGGVSGKQEEDEELTDFMPLDDFKEEKDLPKKNLQEAFLQPVTGSEFIGEAVLKDSPWNQFGLQPALVKKLHMLGFSTPTEIQSSTLVHAITRHSDIIGAAETGSGKTLAYGLPILNQLCIDNTIVSVTGLVLVPTRELALQVVDHLKKVGMFNLDQGVTKKIISIVGGMSMQKQERVLAKIPSIIVATPGRLWSVLQNVSKL